MTVIEQVLAKAVKHDDSILPQIRDELQSLFDKKQDLLPIEKQVITAVDQRATELHQTYQQTSFGLRHGLEMIPLDVLKWHREQRIARISWATKVKAPRLALVNVMAEDGFVAIKYDRNGYSGKVRSVYPDYPEPIKECYSHILDDLQEVSKARDCYSTQLSYQFKGVIPASVREKITQAVESNQYQGVYLLCDVPGWAYSEKSNPPQPRVWGLDPIVVGYAHKALWKLDTFDLTPLERYLDMEFSITPALTAGSET